MMRSETKPPALAISDLFSSRRETIAKFAEMQVHLYRHDRGLQNYFHALDEGMFYGAPGTGASRRMSIHPLAAWSFRSVDRASQFVKPKKIKTDILFCPTPYFGRRTENRFLVRTLLGLAQTGAEILCLLPNYAPFRRELDAELAVAGRSKQVKFLDPGMPFNPVESRTRSIAARLRGRKAFEAIFGILEPHGFTMDRYEITAFEDAARYVEAWERLAPFLEFEAVVARCHWYEFCSPVCHTAMQRGKPVVTFQQGVVGHTLDFPILASKFVTFGSPSTSILAEGNRRFHEAVGLPEPSVSYIGSGSLFDTISRLPDQFHHRTVLLIDMHSAQEDTWGDSGQVQALVRLAERLLASKLPVHRVVIRPHPQWSSFDLEACRKLVREHRDVCELSHPVWSLEEDLRRSSVVVGTWSGALTVASACGLPTIFLETEDGFKTRDLACFSPGQTLLPEAAFDQLDKLLTDPQSYADARDTALRNAGEYYKNGANAALDGEFFTRLLSRDPEKKAEPERRLSHGYYGHPDE